MNLAREVLDNLLVDRHRHPLGRVDGIVLETRDGAPPRLAFIEAGGRAAVDRLQAPLRAIALAIVRRWGVQHGEAFRIPWSKVRHVGIELQVDLDAERTPAYRWEDRARDYIILKIPGA